MLAVEIAESDVFEWLPRHLEKYARVFSELGLIPNHVETRSYEKAKDTSHLL